MAISGSGKISLSSAIFIALTSMIGGGIFVKTKTLNSLAHNHVSPIVFLFFIFLLNIFAFSYVLVRIIPSQTGDMGFMEWSKKFCSGQMHKCFCNFVRFFYHPISLVIFSIYGAQGLLGSLGSGPLSTMILAFGFVMVIMTVNFLSFKWAHRLQMILWSLVLVPLLLLPLLGLFSGGGSAERGQNNQNSPSGLDSFGPWMLLISGLPSVLFIYDGFYNLASLKSKLESNKSLSVALLSSFAIVTVLYLYVLIGFNVGDPVSADYQKFSFFSSRPVLKEIFEILISCSSFLTLNSIALGNVSQLVAMNETHRYKDVKLLRKFLFYKKNPEFAEFESKFIVFVYLIIKTFFWFLIVGVFAIMLGGYSGNKFFDVIDSLADIVSVFVFVILASIIIKSFRYLRYKKFSSLFKACAITSSSLIMIALSYLFISYLVGVTGYAGANAFASWIKLLLLIVFVIGSTLPQINKFLDRKFFNKRVYDRYPDIHKGSIIVFN